MDKPSKSGESAAPAKISAGESAKDTIQSVLIAFILAFVFRAFVVEAFVIPTGSMATTLLGAHMHFRCESCGYAFDENYTSREVGPDQEPVVESRTGPVATRQGPMDVIYSMHCQNCGHPVPLGSTRDGEGTATNTPVLYGDRILVLKYEYVFSHPHRWDVVVFKSPDSYPSYSQNYIKRLVALPGEVVMLLDGDVYTLKDDPALLKQKEWWQLNWQVQPKPWPVQKSLLRDVYDNDYYPQDKNRQKPWVRPWRQVTGDGWDKAARRVLSFDNAQGTGTLVFDKSANQGWYPLTDWLSYDEPKEFMRPGSLNPVPEYRARWYVSDLDLSFYYQRQSGQGPLRATLSKLGHTFTAEIGPDYYLLRHRVDATGEEGQVGGRMPLDAQAQRGPIRVEFSNIDYQVTLRVNDLPAVATTASNAVEGAKFDPSLYGPDLQDLAQRHERRQRLGSISSASPEGAKTIRDVFPEPTITLSADRQSAQVSHLRLMRDIYYTPQSGDGSSAHAISRGDPETPVVLAKAAGDVENEYWVLGDNSLMSLDARLWRNTVDLRRDENLYAPAGVVPERFMIGRAFFVYWPAGYRPFSDSMPGIVPNFGDMRFIH